MELQHDVFPNFYKKYKWLAEEEDAYFTGRENYLRNFWRDLCNVSGIGESLRRNRAFVGPRKLGKTTFLRRCYNVAFWEQELVIPFYHCFPQKNNINLREHAESIVFKFLQQAVCFVTKDPNILNIALEKIIFSELKKRNFKCLDHLEMYWEHTKQKIENSEPQSAMEAVWNWAKMLSLAFGKKTLLIIDEYQKTYESLQEEGITVPCHESIAEIINNDNILTIISGSKISMLAYNILTAELHNRIPSETFFPLKKREAFHLILKYAKNRGFKNIEKKVYEMVGGNPYYIKILFSPTNYYDQEYDDVKKWFYSEELEKTFNFEFLHHNGEVFRFWETHLAEKQDLLDRDGLKEKGTSLQLLRYIAEKKDGIHLDELREKFPKVKNMKEKMKQLRKADFILDSTQSEKVFHFSDVVLPLVLTKMHQKLITGFSTQKAFEKYKETWYQRNKKDNQRIEQVESSLATLHNENMQAKHQQNIIVQDVKNTKVNLSKIKIEIKNYFAKQKKIKAKEQGKISIAKGAKAESKFQRNIKKYIKAHKGIFANYELVSKLQDVNIKLTSGKGAQIDLFGELRSLNGIKPKKCLIVGEIKDRKKKIGKSEAQAFIDKIAMLRCEHKIPNAICVYVCSSGFWKSASKLLEKNNIFHGTSDKFLQNL